MVAQIEDLISSTQENWPTLACPRNNGTRFWSHEWEKHALTIREKVNLLSVLKNTGIEPGGFYSLEAVKEAIKNGTGHEAAIQCNKEAHGNNQLYQVYLCVDKYGTDLIDCPILPKRKCNETIEFATFGTEAFVEEGSSFTLSLESDQSSTQRAELGILSRVFEFI
ncbi:extracellular ribonuclease LE-like [Lycium ferocissimum]|uniref:extracellular ribonuclease LE-like n=1 Tax=Lycium ferocissimum TaxID=112874 RepID=UPI0028159BAD|nr:extracellular ribonuclease LE-like [Lycium ferocissimum]